MSGKSSMKNVNLSPHFENLAGLNEFAQFKAASRNLIKLVQICIQFMSLFTVFNFLALIPEVKRERKK